MTVVAWEIGFWLSAGIVVYVYFGYAAQLWLIKSLSGGRPPARDDIEPRVTLIVSAFNEEDVIGDKVRNSLELDYPEDQLEILVVSDASDDNTDRIVSDFSESNVKLLRMPERGGKTLGLNAAVEGATGEILVFSDANAMYRPDAIRALVHNFADPTVGAVVGESTYSSSANEAEESESLYWRYEIAIKKLESALGSVVGGDGAIYATRKKLYQPMPADALSDFVNPCQTVRQGLRCVYEPTAVSVEEAAGSFDKEFSRKVRIVNRAWRAVMSMKGLLNPFRHGFFAFKLLSHKVLRWLAPVFMLIAFAANAVLVPTSSIYAATFAVQVLFYALAAAGALVGGRSTMPKLIYVPYYFCLVNIASLRGIIEAYRGRTYTTWSTARTD